MKPHELVARDGEDAAAQGLTGSLPCSLTAWDFFFLGSDFCNKCSIFAGWGLDCSETHHFSCLLRKIYRLTNLIYLSLQLLEVFTAHLS